MIYDQILLYGYPSAIFLRLPTSPDSKGAVQSGTVADLGRVYRLQQFLDLHSYTCAVWERSQMWSGNETSVT